MSLKVGDLVTHKTLGCKWDVPITFIHPSSMLAPAIVIKVRFRKWAKVRYGPSSGDVRWFRVEELERYYTKEEREAFEQILNP